MIDMDAQNPIYVTGHKNPDTDSIVSAIAYAALMNALGDRRYTAARLGTTSDETAHILERFGFAAPERIYNVFTQVRDLNFDRPPVLSSAVTVRRAWETMLKGEGEATFLPVAGEDGKLLGMVTTGDIAAFDLESSETPKLDEIPLFNLVSNLDGQLWDCNSGVAALSGNLRIAVPQVGAEGTVLLAVGNCDTVEEAFNVKIKDHTVFLPGVLSRKKQIVPALSILWG